MTEYNGHKDRGHWNVALWLGNDEALYLACMAVIRDKPTLRAATQHLLKHVLPEKTGDNFKYTHARVLAALEGLQS
jgi:hypothetical protein